MPARPLRDGGPSSFKQVDGSEDVDIPRTAVVRYIVSERFRTLVLPPEGLGAVAVDSDHFENTLAKAFSEWARQDSNLRPRDYESGAGVSGGLPSSRRTA